MGPSIRIGLIFDYDTGYCRGVLRGIKRFAEARPRWALVPVAAEPEVVESLGRLNVSGLVSWVFQGPVASCVEALALPWVSVCGAVPDGAAPRVGPDDVLMGRLAAEHLIGLGLRRFAFIGHVHHAGAKRRESGFIETMERSGFEVDRFRADGPRLFRSTARNWSAGHGFRRWVRSLSAPLGVAAYYDFHALQFSETCREVGLRVPEDVAIVGMGNDDFLCDFARPSLSSVDVASERIGYEAAALLDRLMNGQPPPPGPALVPPPGLVVRQSSDVLAVGDAEVAAALRFIRCSSHRPIQVVDVLNRVLVSRRLLERRFHHLLGRGIAAEIRRARIEHAKDLLARTELDVAALAMQAGFSHGGHLANAFRQAVGMSPTAYRNQFRAPGGPGAEDRTRS